MKFWAMKRRGALHAYTDEDKQKINKLSVREPVLLRHTRVRSPKLHRKYFAFIAMVYKNMPEKFEGNWPTIDTFRKEMEMGAGHYELTINLRGERAMQPKSIKYEALDDIEFSDLFTGVKNVIGRHIMPYVDTMVEELERFY